MFLGKNTSFEEGKTLTLTDPTLSLLIFRAFFSHFDRTTRGEKSNPMSRDFLKHTSATVMYQFR